MRPDIRADERRIDRNEHGAPSLEHLFVLLVGFDVSFGLGLVVVGSAYGGDGHAKDCDCGTRGRGSGRSNQSLIA